MNLNNKDVHKLLAGAIALVLVMGFSTPAFGQTLSSGGTEPFTGDGIVATTVHTATSICTVIDFEGGGDSQPVGTISGVTFSANGLGLIDSDQGGAGNFANEPSPDTILFSLVGNLITATLANPVNEISWNYASQNPAEIRVFGAGNVLLSTIALPAIAQVNPGDPTGFFSTWDSGFHTEVGNVITSIEYDGFANEIGWDDLDFCIAKKVVGGELLPINTTALLVAGAQTNAVWIISALAVIGSVAFGALYLKTRRN